MDRKAVSDMPEDHKHPYYLASKLQVSGLGMVESRIARAVVGPAI